jgi:hypothetical protein
MDSCKKNGGMCIWHTVYKWRTFHLAIDVYPDFCDVIVKTCCILHTFRQRDDFHFQDTLYECPLENIKAIGTTGTDMGRRAQETGVSLRGGPVGKDGSGLVYRGLMCGRRLWRRVPLSMVGGGVR